MLINTEQDGFENKKTLNELIGTMEKLNSLNAVIGRNERMFAVDISKVPDLLNDVNNDLGKFLASKKLIVENENISGTISIVTEGSREDNILFLDVANAVFSKDSNKVETYPHLFDVQNWFLNIPLFSENDKLEYEPIYNRSKANLN